MTIKRGMIVTTFAALVCAGVIGGASLLRASDSQPLANEQLNHVATTCETVKLSLRQLHRNDALMRVDRGQLYEFIGTKLMARLNSRMAINRLDAGQLVASAAEYEVLLAEFRTTYKSYEEKLSSALRIDCAKHPQGFYNQVAAARAARKAVHASVLNLNKAVDEYYEEFGRFASSYGVETRGLL